MTCRPSREPLSVCERDLPTNLLEGPMVTFSSNQWSAPVANTECTLHQLAPYIGKLKSSIAADLINAYTAKGELIADPFCGSGTIA
jgi:hypothetical protein